MAETDKDERLLLGEIENEELSEQEEGLYEHHYFKISGGQSPLRIDRYLTGILPNVSRSKIQHAAEVGAVTVNGGPVKSSYKVRPADEIRILLPYPPPPALSAEPIPLDIPYEDETLLLVNKAPGMVCHPSIGHRNGTMIHGLLWHFEQQQLRSPGGDPLRPGLVHRIDKDTSGIIVIAKTDYAMAHLAKQFFDRTSERLYYAVAWGDLKADSGTVTGNIGRSASNRKLFTVYPPESDLGKHAVTHFEVMERFGIATFIRLKLQTGRTHQIRVHMKHIGHTLLGDEFYGGDKAPSGPNTNRYRDFVQRCLAAMPRQALHAKTLGFNHPASGQRLYFDSPLPQDFEQLLALLRSWNTALH